MREVLDKFDFDNTITKLDDAGLLFQVMERFKAVDLHPDKIDNPTMGTIFEEPTSTSTPRRARSRRSKPTCERSRRTSSGCWPR